MKTNSMITLLKQAITQCDKSIEATTGQQNPQLKEMLIEAKAKREAYQDVLEALRGDTLFLRIAARCPIKAL